MSDKDVKKAAGARARPWRAPRQVIPYRPGPHAPGAPVSPQEAPEAPSRPDTRAEPGDALDAFLRDMERHPRLTEDETVALGERIQRGIRRHRPDEEAVTALVNGNLRLLVDRATRYAHAKGRDRDGIAEAVSMGAKGLIQAARKYNPARSGPYFYRYAATWVEREMAREGSRDGHALTTSQRFTRNVVRVRQALERLRLNPSAVHVEVLMQETGLSRNRVTWALTEIVSGAEVRLDDHSSGGSRRVNAPIYHEVVGTAEIDNAWEEQEEHAYRTRRLFDRAGFTPEERARVLSLHATPTPTMAQSAAAWGVSAGEVARIKAELIGRLLAAKEDA